MSCGLFASLSPVHVVSQQHRLSTVCVCVFVCGEGVFKGAAKVHFESLGPLSTHSLHPSNLRRYTTTIWPYVPCIGDVWGAGVWRILEKGSTGTVSITEWCRRAAESRVTAWFYTCRYIIAVLQPFSLLMELWDYQQPTRIKSFQIQSTPAFYYHHYVGEICIIFAGGICWLNPFPVNLVDARRKWKASDRTHSTV